MKANYNLTKRHDPSTKEMKWYATPAGKGAMDADETAKMAVADTTLSKAEFKSVMEVASEKLIPLILSGISVTIGDLGKLRLSFGSQGVENMDDFDPQTMIKNVKFVFTPSATLKSALAQATFEQEGIVESGIKYGSKLSYLKAKGLVDDSEDTGQTEPGGGGTGGNQGGQTQTGGGSGTGGSGEE